MGPAAETLGVWWWAAVTGALAAAAVVGFRWLTQWVEELETGRRGGLVEAALSLQPWHCALVCTADRVIRHSRDLGFSLERIGQLLDLWQDRKRFIFRVKTLAQTRITELDKELKKLREMRGTLRTSGPLRNGNDRPDCPIIESLASEAAVRGTAANVRGDFSHKRQ